MELGLVGQAGKSIIRWAQRELLLQHYLLTSSYKLQNPRWQSTQATVGIKQLALIIQ